MLDNKYTVTFRLAIAGDNYKTSTGDKNDSVAGHLWYVLHKNGQQILSSGFQSLNHKPFDEGAVTNHDEKNYISSHPESSITIQISQEQYETLIKFGDNNGTNAKSMGFSTDEYDVLTHNCVHYVFHALKLIGYKSSNPINLN
ncbi:hypothetical protein A1D29_03530 [Pasteurellaceae bacterium Orientalotternb1]|nr:hypothetical protein A1D29_03530 [Pasteurellaceae bacterium Orientalotternb1]